MRLFRALCGVLLLCRSAVADDLETIRVRALNLLCWPAPSSIAAVVAQARAWASSLNASFYWPDINYNDPHDRANWATINHISRTETIVQALTVPGSPAFEDPALSASAHGALGVWLKEHWVNDNWWYQWIGVPLSLSSIQIMLGANRTTAAEMELLTLYSYDAAWWIDAWGGGANLVWMIEVELLRGLATRNTTAVSQGFDSMWADVSVKSPLTNGQGIMPDGSYHFHGQQPLNYAYGADWLLGVLLFHTAAVNTSYDLVQGAVDTLAAFIAAGDAQMSFNNYFDYSLTGRGIDRPRSSFAVPFPTSQLRDVARSCSSPSDAAAIVAWAELLEAAPGAAPLVGARYFWTSDFLTVHRARWGASLKAHGNNSRWTVVGGECDNGENVLGEHEGDGVLSVYGDVRRGAAGTEYVPALASSPDAVFPLWDWAAMNGITAEHAPPIETCGAGDVWPVINTAFVGAACDGLYAAFVHDTASHNLTAQRAFFFFDDAILALASEINDPAPAANPRTAIASRLLPYPAADPTGRLAVDFANGSIASDLPDGAFSIAPSEIAWLHAGAIGYVPAALGPASSSPRTTLRVQVGNETGDWSKIGAFNAIASARLLQVQLDHGDGAPTAHESYAYAIFPAASAAAMPALAASLGGVDRACIVNTHSVQGAADPAASVAQAVFWAAGAYACTSSGGGGGGGGWNITIASTSAAIVLLTEDAAARSVTVSVAHPNLLAPRVAQITVGGRPPLSGPACTPAPGGGGGTLFSLAYQADANFMGATITATCNY